MKFIRLDEAIQAIAMRIGLPDFADHETRAYERAGGVVDREKDYLHACKYSLSAAVLHQCITNAVAPQRWWSTHPDTGMAVIDQSVAEQGLFFLARVAGLLRQEQNMASNHLISSYQDSHFLDEKGMPRRKVRTLDVAELHSRMNGFYQFQTIGFVLDEIAQLLDVNGITHELEKHDDAVCQSFSRQPLAEDDRTRRLTALRELGGSISWRKSGNTMSWVVKGIKSLVTQEKNQGRKRCDEKTIRADLKIAAEAESLAKREGQSH